MELIEGKSAVVTICASRKRIIYSAPEYVIAVFSAKADKKLFPECAFDDSAFGKTLSFVAKGPVQDQIESGSYLLTGNWELDKKKKLVFFFNSIRIKPPQNNRDINRFLTQNTGIDKSIIKKIVATYGEKTIEMGAKHPEEIRQKFNLTDQDTIKLKRSCKNLMIQVEVDDFLSKNDIVLSGRVVSKLVRQYGEATIDILSHYPYKLIRMISFKSCDEIGTKVGVPLSARKRAVAALIEAQRQGVRSTGSLCVDANSTVTEALRMCGDQMPFEQVQAALTLLTSNYVFVQQGNWLYTKDDFISERACARGIWHMCSRGVNSKEAQKIKAALEKWKAKSPIQLSEKQEQAVLNTVYPVSIITGGPGTGKSTTLKAILDVYKMAFPHEDILCMAPTGRAAKRMSECTDMPAFTIHSACGLIPSDVPGGFAPQDDTKIHAHFIAIDEMSMVGIHLFDWLIQAIDDPDHTKIVLLGDVDQLPSVTAGNVLEDLIQSTVVKTTVLDRNYRQGEKSSIADAAYQINAGDPNLKFDEQFRFEDCYNPNIKIENEEAIKKIIELYRNAVQVYGIANCIILSPTHYYRDETSSPFSTDHLNELVQEAVNPAKSNTAYCKVNSKIFRENDRIVQTKNTTEAMNGDIGTIKEIINTPDGVSVRIEFDSGTTVDYDSNDMHYIELGYCLTVHKVQGSEFQFCVMPASMTQKVMLVRRLFYTAVTRAKKEFVFVGNRAALNMAIRTVGRSRRSLFAPRLLKQKTEASK